MPALLADMQDELTLEEFKEWFELFAASWLAKSSDGEGWCCLGCLGVASCSAPSRDVEEEEDGEDEDEEDERTRPEAAGNARTVEIRLINRTQIERELRERSGFSSSR